MTSLSIIIPVLDEALGIVVFLERLAGVRATGAQIIVADGGSGDGTPELARPLADLVIACPRGRALQMNAGAAHAAGTTLLFLHADTLLPEHAQELIEAALATHQWGRFDVELAGTHPLLKVVAVMMNMRSRLTGIATGDQGIFMRREAFERLGGFAPIPLMEDIELSRRARRLGRPACLSQRVTTSARRWEKRGVLRTVLLMWRLRLAYFLGADPRRLALAYGYRGTEEAQ